MLDLLSDKYSFYLMAAYGVALTILIVLSLVSQRQRTYLRHKYMHLKDK